jgi:hypothetical protein
MMVIQRGKVTYVIYDDRILCGIGEQWTSYNPYENWNRAGITQFINAIIKSKETEYITAADFMSLAYHCGIRGISTRKPKM